MLQLLYAQIRAAEGLEDEVGLKDGKVKDWLKLTDGEELGGAEAWRNGKPKDEMI